MSIENDNSYRLAGGNATPPTSTSYWVIDGRFLAGAYPGAPEPDKHNQTIQALLDAGIRLFVNLMEPDVERPRPAPGIVADGMPGP